MCKEDTEEGITESDNNKENEYVDVDESPTLDAMMWPEDRIGSLFQFFQNWTFSYMGPVLQKGSRQKKTGKKLVESDLFTAPRKICSDVLTQTFHEQVQLHAEKPPVRRTMYALWAVAAPTFVPAGLCMFLSLSCQVALPLLVLELLRLLESNPVSNVAREGVGWALAVCFCTILNAFNNHRHRHLAMKSGVAMRAAAVNVLYDHVLHLSPEGKIGLASGELTNLIATDTQKLYEVMQDGHLVWGLPLCMVAVTTCLLLVMGPTTLIGLAILIMFVPLVRYVMTSMLAVRHKRAQWTDKRIKLINSMIQGIKVTKLNNYEESYEKRILETRRNELGLLRKENAVWALTLVLTVSAPVVATAAAFALYVLVDESHTMTPSRSFSVLLLFSALRFPINFAGRLLGKMTQAYSALQRIAEFLDRPRRALDDGSFRAQIKPGDTPLLLENAGFVVQPSEEPGSGPSFQVSKFSFSVKKGETLAVCGPVGGGKSSLINGIIGDMQATSNSTVVLNGSAALARQDAFIINATVRDNITFGRKFDLDFYEKVLGACCLYQDLELLGPARDLTEIGERGVTLSGGQKQRVALARAAYARPDIVLLDDPFSALDAGTGAKVFESLINEPDALFSSSAVILVTHASHFIRQVNKMVLIVDGHNAFSGSWSELESFEAKSEKVGLAVNSIRSAVTENQAEGLALANPQQQHNKSNRADDKGIGSEKHKLMTIEEREHGLSSFRTWLLWFTHAGGIWFIIIMIFLLAADRFIYVGVEYFLARWTEGATKPVTILGVDFDSQESSRKAQFSFLAVYAGIVLASVVGTTMRSEFSVTGGVRAAEKVFVRMLRSVLRAPMSYFESTPSGRLLNRFTYDTEVIDVTMTQNMSMFLISCSWFFAGVAVISSIVPWTLLAIMPVTVSYMALLWHYPVPIYNDWMQVCPLAAPTVARLTIHSTVSRSPIQAAIGEGLDGASTMHVFQQTVNFTKKFRRTVDRNTACLLNFISAQRWLGLRIELLGSVVVLASTVLVVSLNGVFKIETGLIGLLVIWSGNFTVTLGFLVDTLSEAEAAITAIERVDAMVGIPEEDRKPSNSSKLPTSWPSKGNIVFDNVKMRYRPGLPLALKGLSLNVKAGTRCGIVGRTGAGKSSLTTVLFRLVELESGSILLDGVDLSSIGLDDVRGRLHGMAIIPQDPFLTGDTIRQCIDPFGRCSDEEILEAFKAVRLATDGDSVDVLNRPVEEGGSNYSTGERQLFFFAQTLLSNPRVLVLDEATSSTDGETDAFLQNMLRTKFSNTTLITVAHRLDTVIDYDQIVVLEEGKVAESGSPADLLAAEGKFANLVDSAGPKASRLLRSMVQQNLE